MKVRKISTLILSGLFSLFTLVGCTKDDLGNLKGQVDYGIADLRNQIEELDNKIEALRGDMNEEILTVKEEFQSKINDSNSEITSLRADLLELSNKHDKDKLDIETDYNDKLTLLETNFSNNISSLQASINSNTAAINELTEQHNNDIEELRNDYDSKISALDAADKAAREALKSEFNASLSNLNTTFAAQLSLLQNSINNNTTAITNLNNKHDNDVASLTEDYEAKIEALAETDEAARNELEEEFSSQLEELNSSFLAAINELNATDESLEEEITELSNKHSSDIASITSDYETKIANQEQTDSAARESLRAEYTSAISSLNQKFTDDIAALQSDLNANVSALSAFISQYNTDKQTLQNDYNTKISNLEATFTQAQTSINNQIAALQSSINSLTSDMNSQIAAIQSDYIGQINELTGRVATLENVPTHTVNFEVRGDITVDVPSQTVVHGEKAFRPYLIAEPGYYYFTNWYVDCNYFEDNSHEYVEEWYFKSGTVTEDMTLYTYVYAYSYDITLNDNNSTSSADYSFGSVETGESYTLPVPYYTGHAFEGWYYGETQVTDEDGRSLAPFNFADDITLYAHWREVPTVFRKLSPSELHEGVAYNLVADNDGYSYAVDADSDDFVATSKNITDASDVYVIKENDKFIIKVGDSYLGYDYYYGSNKITRETSIDSDKVVRFDYCLNTFAFTFDPSALTHLTLASSGTYMLYSELQSARGFFIMGYGEDVYDNYGTAENPLNVEEAMLCLSLNVPEVGTFTSSDVYVTGVISSVSYDSTYHSYTINLYNRGFEDAFQIYSAQLDDGVEADYIQVGAIVTAYGPAKIHTNGVYEVAYNSTTKVSPKVIYAEWERPECTGLELNKDSITIEVESEYQLLVSAYPQYSLLPSGEIKWESSNTNVATVEDGVVTAINKGTATITVYLNDLDSASCVVTVVEKGSLPSEITVSFNVTDYCEANSLTAGTKLASIELDSVITASFSGTDGNTGKVYKASSGTWEIRFYGSGNGTLSFSAASGYEIVSVVVGLATSNYGTPTDTAIESPFSYSRSNNFNIKTMTVVYRVS